MCNVLCIRYQALCKCIRLCFGVKHCICLSTLDSAREYSLYNCTATINFLPTWEFLFYDNFVYDRFGCISPNILCVKSPFMAHYWIIFKHVVFV